MSGPYEDSKGAEEPDDPERTEDPKLRTDGGEVAAQHPGVGNTGIADGPTGPQAGAPLRGDRGENHPSLPEDTRSNENQVGDLSDSVESHFTPAELKRLRRIAESKNAQSAWVIKRLFRDPEE